MATEKLNTWRLRQLVDEPLYCAAPKTEDLDNDFVCYDSDEQLSDSARLAKRQRYEAAGQRYLDGHRPRLISASLRGPFDASSGWVNPWLPKTSTTRARSATKPFAAVDDQRRTASHGRITTLTQDANYNLSAVNTCANSSSIQGLEPSMMPAEESSMETPNVHLRYEKRTRIQAWAESVELGLPEDDKYFWNPQSKPAVQEKDDVPTENDTVRSLGWLKKTPLKRKRSGNSPATSGQTAKKPVALNRSVSDSAAIYHKPPISLGVLRKEASAVLLNQSFELTPSSLADPPPLGHLREGQLAPVSESDYPSTAGDTICPAIRDLHKPAVQESNAVKETNCHTTTTTSAEEQEVTIGEPYRKDDTKMKDDSTPQTCPVVPDESSFRYRVPRQESSLNEAHGLDRTAHPQNLTQTETPESSHHPDESIKPADPAQMSDSKQAAASIVGSTDVQDCERANTTVEHGESTKSSDNEVSSNLLDLVDKAEGLVESSTSSSDMPIPATAEIVPTSLPGDVAEALPHDVEMQDHDKVSEGENKPTVASMNVIADVVEEPDGSATIENFNLQAMAASATQLSQSEESTVPELAQLSEEIKSSTDSTLPVVQDSEASVDVQPDATRLQSPSSESPPMQLASLLNNVNEGDAEPEVVEKVTASEAASFPQQTDAFPASQQSPWSAKDLHTPLPSAILNPSKEVESPALRERSTPLGPVLDLNSRTESRRDSLDLGIQLKSFSHFNTSPPQSQRIKKLRSRNSTGQLRSILSTKASPSPWSRKHLVDDNGRRASHSVRRRVTFAPLPGSTEDELDVQDHVQSTVRAASPPPAVSFSAADEDVTDQFQKHFESVKQNRSGRRRSSQPLVRLSPEKEIATGIAHELQEPVFEAARDNETQTSCAEVAMHESPSTPTRPPARDLPHQSSPGGPQSPWRADTQTDQLDDVAAVMGNLDAFLDAWNVDTEMQRASQGMEMDKENSSQEKSKDKLGDNNRFGLQELSIWN